MAEKRWRKVKGKWLYGDKKLTAIKAIHRHCSSECLQSAQQVQKCTDKQCRFWGFRNANNPNRLKRHQTTTHPRKARSGKFSPLYDGKKRVNIKGLEKGGKIFVEMPKEAVLVIRQQTKKRGKK